MHQLSVTGSLWLIKQEIHTQVIQIVIVLSESVATLKFQSFIMSKANFKHEPDTTRFMYIVGKPHIHRFSLITLGQK